MLHSVFDRSAYPTLTDAVYLNQAALGLIGEPAVVAMRRLLDEVVRHGNVYMSDEEEEGFLDSLRVRAARLFQVQPSRIAILSSASELLSQIPFMLVPPVGTKVIAVSSDFPAITRPWLRMFDQGGPFRMEFVDDRPGSDLTGDLIARIDDETFLVAVGHVQYATGTLVDVPRLRTATSRVGARLVVDATQSAGALETPVEAWNADIVVSSGYKWLGGHGGAAIGAIGPGLGEATPAMPGWMGAPSPFEFDATALLLATDARRYTQSTMSYVSVAGLTAAIDELLDAGIGRIERHADRLAHSLVDAAEVHGYRPFRDLDDPAASSHIISLRGRHTDIGELSRRLRSAGVVCGSRAGRLRVSLAPYNDESDIAALADALS